MTPADIRALRQKLGLTQAGLAAHLGIGQVYLCNLETGSKQPTKTLVALLRMISRHGLDT